jgi:predicted DsbA family dithiol-disulfide isomerase
MRSTGNTASRAVAEAFPGIERHRLDVSKKPTLRRFAATADAARALRYAEREGRYERMLAAVNEDVEAKDVP